MAENQQWSFYLLLFLHEENKERPSTCPWSSTTAYSLIQLARSAATMYQSCAALLRGLYAEVLWLAQTFGASWIWCGRALWAVNVIRWALSTVASLRRKYYILWFFSLWAEVPSNGSSAIITAPFLRKRGWVKLKGFRSVFLPSCRFVRPVFLRDHVPCTELAAC